jgi:two-component system chemotaxis response regulator CheY
MPAEKSNYSEETMPKTILTVDDSASVRQLVGFSLREAGYDTVEACDGSDALTKLGANMSLVITDLNMPKMNGIELIRQIRTQSTNRYVPILVLTTESQPEKKQAAKAAGATGWIVKPFRPEQLLAAVAKVLG